MKLPVVGELDLEELFHTSDAEVVLLGLLSARKQLGFPVDGLETNFACWQIGYQGRWASFRDVAAFDSNIGRYFTH